MSDPDKGDPKPSGPEHERLRRASGWATDRTDRLAHERAIAIRILEYGARVGWPTVNTAAAVSYAGDRARAGKFVSELTENTVLGTDCSAPCDPEWLILDSMAALARSAAASAMDCFDKRHQEICDCAETATYTDCEDGTTRKASCPKLHGREADELKVLLQDFYQCLVDLMSQNRLCVRVALEFLMLNSGRYAGALTCHRDTLFEKIWWGPECPPGKTDPPPPKPQFEHDPTECCCGVCACCQEKTKESGDAKEAEEATPVPTGCPESLEPLSDTLLRFAVKRCLMPSPSLHEDYPRLGEVTDPSGKKGNDFSDEACQILWSYYLMVVVRWLGDGSRRLTDSKIFVSKTAGLPASLIAGGTYRELGAVADLLYLPGNCGGDATYRGTSPWEAVQKLIGLTAPWPMGHLLTVLGREASSLIEKQLPAAVDAPWLRGGGK